MDEVITVSGVIPASQLGPTLMHEHLLVDMRSASGEPMGLDDLETSIQELKVYERAGGAGLVDVSPPGLRLETLPLKHPLALRRIVEATGVQIVASTGYYLESYYPEHLLTQSVDELAAGMVKDIMEGIEGTAIRAGIIGEIGTGDLFGRDFISPAEEKVLQASARAHLQTGVPITTHTFCGQLASEQLDLLEAEGVNLRRVVVGHLDWGRDIDLENCLAIAKRGAYVEFDLVGREGVYEYVAPPVRTKAGQLSDSPTSMEGMRSEFPPDERRVQAILAMSEAGFLQQILLSHDTFRKDQLHAYGGPGYDHLLSNFVPMLAAAGLSSQDIHALLVENPRRVLTISR